MAKEITLAELTNSRPTSNPSTRGEIVSPSELASRVRTANGITDDEIEAAPLIQDAFDSVRSTLDKRKDFIENEVMPVIEANAREMAEAAANGIDITTVKLPERTEEEVHSIINSDFDDEDEFLGNYNTNYLEDKEHYDDFQDKVHNTSWSSEEQFTEEDESEETYEVEPVEENNEFEEDVDALDSLIDELDEDISTDENETDEQLRNRFKQSFDSVKITKNPIDLSSFTIRHNAVSSSKVLNTINKRDNYKRADWVLFHSGRSMTFEEGRGQELDALRKTIGNSNGINNIKAVLQYIYNHVVDANKPSFEEWCKLIRTEDIESLYFGHYIACYSDANMVMRECSKDNDGCGKSSLIETNIRDMVKFKDAETERKFNAIFSKDTTTESTAFESQLLQISDDFVISYNHPTLYSTFIQYSTLDPKITEKYSDILDTMAYIDGFFTIDRASKQLIPLAINEYPNNFSKTVAAKIKVYTAILKTLSNDQYNALTAKLNTVFQAPKVTYIYPEVTCPECGATIPEQPIDSVLGLLFTRAQLAQVKSL